MAYLSECVQQGQSILPSVDSVIRIRISAYVFDYMFQSQIHLTRKEKTETNKISLDQSARISLSYLC